MTTIRKTITVTDKQDKWIKSQINNGDFTNESEYVRSLIRREQGNNEKFLKLKSEIQKGLDNGVSDRTIEDIWKEAEEKYKEKNG